jgi:hypothetical protein
MYRPSTPSTILNRSSDTFFQGSVDHSVFIQYQVPVTARSPVHFRTFALLKNDLLSEWSIPVQQLYVSCMTDKGVVVMASYVLLRTNKQPHTTRLRPVLFIGQDGSFHFRLRPQNTNRTRNDHNHDFPFALVHRPCGGSRSLTMHPLR